MKIEEEEDMMVVVIKEAEKAEKTFLIFQGKRRDLKDVECYKCGESGHHNLECLEMRKRPMMGLR